MGEKNRGMSPPHRSSGRDWVGEGQGHKVKGPASKGGGYARSTHMKGDVGGPGDHKGYGKGVIHGEYHTTGEKKTFGSAHRLPGERNIGFRDGLIGGDHFEGEIKEHFPGKKGVAGIHNEGTPVKNWETKDAKGHGRASGKALHHMNDEDGRGGQSGKNEVLNAHAFTKHPQGSMAHGYGHDHEKKLGHLRLSGHASAHRIGKR